MLEDIRLTLFRAVAAKLPPLLSALGLHPAMRFEFTDAKIAAFLRGRDAAARRTLT